MPSFDATHALKRRAFLSQACKNPTDVARMPATRAAISVEIASSVG